MSETRVASFFIDESGSKNSTGNFFVIGCLKSYKPADLGREIRNIRQYHKYYEEIKFSKVNGENCRFYFDLVEEIANSPFVARICASIYDPTTGFRRDKEQWVEQARMSKQLIIGNTNKSDKVICFLDLVQTPKGKTVAGHVKEQVNRVLSGSPVLEAYDIDSKAHDLVQLADLIASGIGFARSHHAFTGKRSPKQRVSERFRRALELDSFDDIQIGKVNILTMGHRDTLPGLDV